MPASSPACRPAADAWRLRRSCSRLAALRPGGQAQPTVGAGLEGVDRRHIHGRRIVAQIMVQERPQACCAEVQSRVAAEADLAQRAVRVDRLAVVPGAERQEEFAVRIRPGMQRLVDRERAVDVFLVPQAVHQHGRHGEFLRAEQLVHRLLLPESIVGRVLRQFAVEPDLVARRGWRPAHRRGRLEEGVVIVVMVGPPFLVVGARGFLFVDVVQAAERAEGAAVEPVVADPAIDHRVHRHRDASAPGAGGPGSSAWCSRHRKCRWCRHGRCSRGTLCTSQSIVS